MDIIAILDTETTGVDPKQDDCIEVAVVMYSLRHKAIVSSCSWLIAPKDEDGWTNAAEHVNHIPTALVLDEGYSPDVAWREVSKAVEHCDAILAHNADFDRQFVPSWFPPDIPWIDTCFGVDWPMQTKPGSNLISLALEHGIAVVDPHRALSDCMLLARLLTRCEELGHNVDTILARGLRPTAMFQAIVTFDNKDKAKEVGFHWEASTKRWLRKMAIEDAAKLPFQISEVA